MTSVARLRCYVIDQVGFSYFFNNFFLFFVFVCLCNIALNSDATKFFYGEIKKCKTNFFGKAGHQLHTAGVNLDLFI